MDKINLTRRTSMIGFDIGGTKCAVSIGIEKNGCLEIKDKRIMPTDLSVSPYEMLDRMCAAAEELESAENFDVIGISCGGPLDSRRGIILSPPNLPGWDEIRVVEYLEKRFGCRAYLQNDANACAVAEWKYGAGKGLNNVVFLTFGTGLGAGLILNGKLYSGATDTAGEVGHIRLGEYGPVGFGKSGSFEGFCSGGGIANLGRIYAQEAFQSGKCVSYCKNAEYMPKINAKEIAELAQVGDADAKRVFDECGKKLGIGLSIIIDILNPDAIILGSIYLRCENLLKDAELSVIEREALLQPRTACKIVSAGLGEKLGDYAALSIAAMNL